MSANASQLFLLADHIKLSLLERQRAQSISSSSTTQDPSIARSLSSFLDGLEALENEVQATPDSTLQDQASELRTQYNALERQFKQSSTSASTNATITHPNDTSLADDFAHAAQVPSRKKTKDRRGRSPYRDEPDGEGASEEQDGRRDELFGSGYRDEPETPDPSQLDNQQIHEQHSQILAEQDTQLDQLGLSIGRQRELSMRIGDELDEQVAMLEDVEEGVDRHQGRLDGAKDRLGRFARKASRVDWSWYVIGGLILILLLLIVVFKR